jgi:hypothetical protein
VRPEFDGAATSSGNDTNRSGKPERFFVVKATPGTFPIEEASTGLRAQIECDYYLSK